MRDREWPEGRIAPDDDGAIQFRIWIDRGRIIICFPREVLWLGLTADVAEDLVRVLTESALELRASEP